MVASLQLGWFRKQMVKVTTPAGRVLAITETLGFGGIQHLLDAATNPRGGFGLQCPNRFQDGQYVVSGDRVIAPSGFSEPGCVITHDIGVQVCGEQGRYGPVALSRSRVDTASIGR